MRGTGRSSRRAGPADGLARRWRSPRAAPRPTATCRAQSAIPGPQAAQPPGRCEWGCGRPDTTANGRMSTGAPSATSRRRRRGVSVAFSDTAPPARTGSASSAAPVRPRIAKRSSRVAITSPSAPATVTGTGTHPAHVGVDRRSEDRCGDAQLGGNLGQLADLPAPAWSKCTKLRQALVTGSPVSVTAAPIAAKTAGQQRPTSASGTV